MNELNIGRLPTALPALHAFEVHGRIREPDVEWMAATLKPSFDAGETIDIIIVIRRYEGVDAGAVFDGQALMAEVRSVSYVRKYAVVGAPDWIKTIINLLAPLSPIEARTFALQDELAAWNWVSAD